ncbi:DUF6493 family protein [Chryseobacterium pennipullorum]|uniref:DUF6493 domain-containing protein n=1 Tax=Chryseobacterium pennipullorum TaxID=2258963 RepID=A0A3D9B4C1_9FLAO|nr:DUF6493 family protein [Chryseobacterium pennipullorum]REC48521.1 hypothetical protein DRF67_06750 [Chryseobacterium pennipullorum]
MLIEEEFKAIYLDDKIREIVPFLKKLTPRDKKEVAAVLKKTINKEWGHNTISVLAAFACCKTRNEYEKRSPGYYAMPEGFIDEWYVPSWLEECILSLREFDDVKVWEWVLFAYLEPADHEILAQQEELLLSFSSTQHFLKILNPVVTHNNFETENFSSVASSIVRLRKTVEPASAATREDCC